MVYKKDAIDVLGVFTQADALGHTPKQIVEALPSAEPECKTEKALRLLVEWAIECGFGYDNIPEEYEKYKDDIADMGYIDGLIYIAKMETEHDK